MENEHEQCQETGPIYGVRLIATLPVGNMIQAMPSRRDLEQVQAINERVVAGYEVAIAKLESLTAELDQLKYERNALVIEEARLISLRDQARAERDELRVLLEKSTKHTADGVRVGWGDKIYPAHPMLMGDPENPDDPANQVPDHAVLKCFICDHWSGEEHDIEYEGMSVESCYSSPEAALAARNTNGGHDD